MKINLSILMKTELLYIKRTRHAAEVTLQPFLLGVFHYAVCDVEENTVGAETFDFWCPSAGGAKRTYTGDIGTKWSVDIKLKYVEIKHDDPLKNDVDELAEDVVAEEIYEDKHQEEEKSKQQMVFNFNVTGNNNSFIQHVDSITNNYYGGQKKWRINYNHRIRGLCKRKHRIRHSICLAIIIHW